MRADAGAYMRRSQLVRRTHRRLPLADHAWHGATRNPKQRARKRVMTDEEICNLWRRSTAAATTCRAAIPPMCGYFCLPPCAGKSAPMVCGLGWRRCTGTTSAVTRVRCGRSLRAGRAADASRHSSRASPRSFPPTASNSVGTDTCNKVLGTPRRLLLVQKKSQA